MCSLGRDRHYASSSVDLSTEKAARQVWVRSLAETGSALDNLEAWMTEEGYPQKDRFAANLSLQEAVLNAVRHGHGGDATKVVHISYVVKPTEVIVQVEDQGTGFDPSQVPNPLYVEHLERNRRWGLFLMRSYTSWMAFNKKGNRVTFGRLHSDR
jgi:serine/threonine-protein kinase RsbW